MTSFISHLPLPISSRGISPPPTFSIARKHDTVRYESSNRVLFTRLDSSENPPSDHSSVFDAAPCTSDDFDELSAARNSDLWAGFDTKENTDTNVKTEYDSAVDLKIASYESPLRRHGEPLETIMEQRSRTTLNLEQRLPNIDGPQTLRHHLSSPCGITRDNPLVNRRRLSRSLDEAGIRKHRQTRNSGLFSEDSEIHESTQYASPTLPPVPAIPRTLTPPGCPRWPGDLPITTVVASPGKRRTTSDHVRSIIRKLVGSPQNNTSGACTLPVGYQPPSLTPSRPVWRPPVSGQFGRLLGTIQSHPFHQLDCGDQEEKDHGHLPSQNEPASTVPTTQHDASTRESSTTCQEDTRTMRAVSYSISSLLSLPGRLFETQRSASPPSSTGLAPLISPITTASTLHSCYTAAPRPDSRTPPPISRELQVVPISLSPTTVDKGEALASSPPRTVPSPHNNADATSASTLDRPSPCKAQGYRVSGASILQRRDIVLQCDQCHSSIRLPYYNSAHDDNGRVSPSGLCSNHDVTDSSPSRSIATASPLCPSVADESMGRETPLGRRLKALHGSLKGLSPLRQVHTPALSILAPSPLRPRHGPTRTYDLFPRPDPNIAPRPHRSLSSMLRFPSGDPQQRGMTNLQREHCVHGQPLNPPPSPIRFTGVKIRRRRWWKARAPAGEETARARCWRCELKLWKAWIVLGCASPEEAVAPVPRMDTHGGDSARDKFGIEIREIVHRLGTWMPGHCFGVADDGASSIVPTVSTWPGGRRMLVD